MGQPDVNEIQKRYAAMTSVQFAALKREELTEVGQQAYDRERARRDTDEFRAEEAREDAQLAKRLETGPKKRGLARLIIGTFFVFFTVALVAVGDSAALFTAALGAFLIWWGASGRQGWQRPLGITWIVFGVILLLDVPAFRRAAAQSGRVFPVQVSSVFLAGGAIMAIVGVVLIAVARRGSRTS